MRYKKYHCPEGVIFKKPYNEQELSLQAGKSGIPHIPQQNYAVGCE